MDNFKIYQDKIHVKFAPKGHIKIKQGKANVYIVQLAILLKMNKQKIVQNVNKVNLLT